MNAVAQDISVALKSERGRRPANEDSGLMLTSDELGDIEGLYVVADGMGGRASGSIASKLAVNAVRDVFLSKARSSDLAALLSESLRSANQKVYSEAQSRPELQGMGTTCVAAAVQEGRVYFAHMGDSRIYLLRDGRLDTLTEDHSFVAEQVRAGKISEEDARKSRFRNVITRAIGLEANAEPTTGSAEFRPGDVLLLCSDGLSGPVKDPEIADILLDSSNPDEACNRLVSAALRNGGSDNVTALVATYGSPKKTRSSSISLVPAVMGVILGIVVGLVLGWQYWRAQTAVEPPSPQPALSSLTYGDPVSLTYSPLSSGTIAVDSENNVYISDRKQKAILKYGADGALLQTVGKGKLTDPGALAVGGDGSIYVLDAGRLKVIRPVVGAKHRLPPPRESAGSEADASPLPVDEYESRQDRKIRKTRRSRPWRLRDRLSRLGQPTGEARGPEGDQPPGAR